jgi:hypothetical protein
LIIFRVRDHRAKRPFPAHAFRCPGGPVLALLLIAFELFLAYRIVVDQPRDSLWTLWLLGSFAAFYWFWSRWRSRIFASRAG